MSNNSVRVSFKVKSFRKIPNPYVSDTDEGLDKPSMYIAICDVRDLPNNIPMKTNPREQNVKTGVAKKIKSSLLGPDQDFYLLNRGLLLSAKSVTFNTYSKELSIDFEDLDLHGDVDGGHTYAIIREYRNEMDPEKPQYVKLEILTGVEDFFQDLAEARNTSTQVKDQSIANLKNQFALIKDTLAKEPYSNDINYNENGNYDIDIGEILALFNMFNIDRYPVNGNSYPSVSYSSNKNCIDYFTNAFEEHEHDPSNNPYQKMCPIMVDIIKLYDHLEEKIATYYGESVPGGKFGSVKGVVVAKDSNRFRTKYYKKPVNHCVAKGFLYPVVGAFRAIVSEKNGKYCWDCDPIALMDEIGKTLVYSAVERSRSLGNNPNAVGKDVQQWLTLFQTVLIQKLLKATR